MGCVLNSDVVASYGAKKPSVEKLPLWHLGTLIVTLLVVRPGRVSFSARSDEKSLMP